MHTPVIVLCATLCQAGEVALDRVTVELIRVAGDGAPFGKFDERLAAIHRLGRLGTDRAFDFLAEHLDAAMLRPGIRFTSGEARDLWEESPYFMALTHTARGKFRYDPRAAAAVLRSLDRPLGRGQVWLASYALIILTTKTHEPGVTEMGPALALVNAELARKPTGDLKTNLETLAEMLRTGKP